MNVLEFNLHWISNVENTDINSRSLFKRCFETHDKHLVYNPTFDSCILVICEVEEYHIK